MSKIQNTSTVGFSVEIVLIKSKLTGFRFSHLKISFKNLNIQITSYFAWYNVLEEMNKYYVNQHCSKFPLVNVLTITVYVTIVTKKVCIR